MPVQADSCSHRFLFPAVGGCTFAAPQKQARAVSIGFSYILISSSKKSSKQPTHFTLMTALWGRSGNRRSQVSFQDGDVMVGERFTISSSMNLCSSAGCHWLWQWEKVMKKQWSTLGFMPLLVGFTSEASGWWLLGRESCTRCPEPTGLLLCCFLTIL